MSKTNHMLAKLDMGPFIGDTIERILNHATYAERADISAALECSLIMAIADINNDLQSVEDASDVWAALLDRAGEAMKAIGDRVNTVAHEAN